MFTVYENILSHEVFLPLHESLSSRPKWQFGLLSDRRREDENSIPFWYINLMDDKFFTEILFDKICSVTNKKFSLETVYGNGQTYGQTGDLHFDHSNEDSYTFLYYVNSKWFVHWGGATVFSESVNPLENKLLLPKMKSDVSKVKTQLFLPKPNSGLLYNGNITHAGLEPTRHCKELRITVAYKLKLK